MRKKVIHTEKAPKAIGPYSQAIRTESFIFTAGQIGLDPTTGELVAGAVEEQTRQALNNLRNVIEAAGSSMDNVVKTTVFLADMNDFAEMNKVYGEYFAQPFPARSAVQVAKLPKGAPLEIECIAVK